MKWSIRLKFLLVMSGLLLLCLGVYMLMAMTVFKSDKTQLVFDLNRSQVSNLASEVETGLTGVAEKLKLVAQLPSHLQNRMIGELFSRDSDLVAVAIYKTNSDEAYKKYAHAQYLETYGFKENDFFKMIGTTQPPLANILREGEAVWNASTQGAPPLIGYGRLVLVLDDNNRPVDQWTIVGYVRLDRFLKSVSIVSISDILISNSHGEILVQKDAENLYSKPSLIDDKIFTSAQINSTRLSVQKIKIDGENWLAASAKAFNDKLVVIAKSPEAQAFLAVKKLTTRTLLFGSIVLTLVILVAFLLSRSLTQNIALLAERMSAVSEGDLTTRIQLRGRDETITLAQTFNKMIFDLKQSRDELEVMNRELDQKVKERTKQLEEQNRKVVEAQEALLKTTRLASMGEVAGRTAHEVLNPLTSLLTRAGLVQKKISAKYKEPLELFEEINKAWHADFEGGGLDKLVEAWKEPSQVDPQKSLFVEDLDNLNEIKLSFQNQNNEITQDMEFIRSEGDRIGKIIHSMRRLGNLQSDVRVHSLHQILTDCCDIMRDLFEQRGFKIEKTLAAPWDRVKVDRDEVIQAITNMMRNSLQALEAAAKTGTHPATYFKLSFETHIDGNKVVVDIRDNGVGIESANQTQLFESRFTTKSREEGTGLGLNIGRRFIRNYGGDMEFIGSKPFENTHFRMILPLDESASKGKASA